MRYFLIFLLTFNVALAQAPASAYGSPTGNNQTTNQSLMPQNGLFESNTFEVFTDKVFDVNSDSIDLDNGTLNWKGKTFNLGNSKIIRARFERYLSTNFSNQDFDNYTSILNEITNLLSVSNKDLVENSDTAGEVLRYAWTRLFDAAEYDYDAKCSLLIANNVNNVFRSRNGANMTKIKVNDLKQAQSREFVIQAQQLKMIADPARQIVGGTERNQRQRDKIADIYRAPQIAESTERMASSKAQVVAAETTLAAIGASAVLQYQSQIVSLLLSRRFQHVIVATSFYRNIFKSTSQAFEVGKDDLATFFPIQNFIPTADSVEGLATEARIDVLIGLKAVNTLYDSNQKFGAMQRLLETFLLGENEPEVLGFPYEKKQVLLKIYKEASSIKDLSDNRDLDGIEEILASIAKDANDFPSTEVMSKVKIAKRASNLKVMAAKQAAAAGKLDEVERNMTQAAEIWPLNPELETLNNDLVGYAVGGTENFKKFDMLYARNDYRNIVAEAIDFGMALRQDADRSAKLKEVISLISQIDLLVAQAKAFESQGNYYFAWELLENAKSFDAKDPVLAEARGVLAPMVADYVKALDAARRAEEAGEYPKALNLYLKALDIFPSSQICRMAVERVSLQYVSK